MFNIDIQKNGKETVAKLSGKLDALTASQLEKDKEKLLKNTETLILDLNSLQYISSAGLRTLLILHKSMFRQGIMIIKNPSDIIADIFEVTGFADILNSQLLMTKVTSLKTGGW